MKRNAGIYKYTNKINNNVYIGQSADIGRRYQQHLYDSKNRANTAIDKAIAKYSIENFNFEIIEECPIEKLDEREIYWISYYDSYHNGYNSTPGGRVVKGEDHGRAILTEDEVWMIRDMYNDHIQRSIVYELFKDTGITERGFLKVWNNETWIGVHSDVYTPENKAWHKAQVGHSENQIGLSSLDRAIKQEEIDNYINDYNNGMSINAIAKKYNRDNGTVERYINNPVEKQEVKYRGRKVQNVNTGLIFSSISKAAKWASCGSTTLTRHLVTDKIAGIVPDTQEPAKWIELS